MQGSWCGINEFVRRRRSASVSDWDGITKSSSSSSSECSDVSRRLISPQLGTASSGKLHTPRRTKTIRDSADRQRDQSTINQHIDQWSNWFVLTSSGERWPTFIDRSVGDIRRVLSRYRRLSTSTSARRVQQSKNTLLPHKLANVGIFNFSRVFCSTFCRKRAEIRLSLPIGSSAAK